MYSHLTCKVANKCLNVRERVEVVEWNKKWSPPFPCCPVSRQWCYGFIFDLLRQFVTKYDRYYYNIRQLFYYKMWQTFITKCDSYYKIWRLLQIATVRRHEVLYVFKIKHTDKILSKILHWSYFLNNFRSSRPDVFCKKGVLRNFAKFTGKHLWILDFE